MAFAQHSVQYPPFYQIPFDIEASPSYTRRPLQSEGNSYLFAKIFRRDSGNPPILRIQTESGGFIMSLVSSLSHEMDRLFYPESVAVVGASPKKGKAWSSGNAYIAGLIQQDFQGKIYPVHPKAEHILGY